MKIDFRMSFGEKNEKTSDISSEAFLISLGLPLFAAGQFGLLLALEPFLQVALVLAGFEQNAGLVDVSLPTTHRIVKRFALADDDFDSHFSLTSLPETMKSLAIWIAESNEKLHFSKESKKNPV